MIRKLCLGCHTAFPANELRESRCQACRQAGWRQRNNRRPPIARATYASPEYRQARRLVLAGATHCAWCKRPASEVGPLTAGHIRSILEEPELAADPGNLAPSCRSCQEREKQQRIRRQTEQARARWSDVKSSKASPSQHPPLATRIPIKPPARP